MRSLSVTLAASSVAVALVGGCSSPSTPPPPPPSSGAAESSAPASSSTKQADDPLPDPAALLHETSKATHALQSAHLTMSVVGTVTETPVKELAGDVTNENKNAAKGGEPGRGPGGGEPGPSDKGDKGDKPGTAAEQGNPAAKGRGKVAILGTEIEFQFAVLGGHLYVALPGAAWVDYGIATRPYSVTSILSPDDGLANVLANFVDPKVEGRETVNGQQTIRVTGKVTPVAVNKFMPQLGATERMPSTVWIQEGGDRQVVEVNLEPNKGNFVQLVFSDWNKPVTVEKPPGV